MATTRVTYDETKPWGQVWRSLIAQVDQINDTIQRLKSVADSMNGNPVDYTLLEQSLGLDPGTGVDVYGHISDMATNIAGANATMKNYYKA